MAGSSTPGQRGGEPGRLWSTEAASPPLQLQGLQSQLEFLEQSMVDKSLVSRQEAKIRELESRLEFERTQVKRLEVSAGLSLCSGWDWGATGPRCEAAQGIHRAQPNTSSPRPATRQPFPAGSSSPSPQGELPASADNRNPAAGSSPALTEGNYRLSGPAKCSCFIFCLCSSAGGAEQLSSPLNIFLAVISLPCSLCRGHKYAAAGSAAGGERQLFFPYVTRCNYFTHS